jgi:hypothetical protein
VFLKAGPLEAGMAKAPRPKKQELTVLASNSKQAFTARREEE